MYTSTYLKKIFALLKYLHTQGLVGLHGSLKMPHTSPSLQPWAIDWVFPELAKPGPLLTHTALSPRSLSQNSWMQTRHMRPLSGLCAAREGAPLPGCQHSLRLWLFPTPFVWHKLSPRYHPSATSVDLGFLWLSRASQQLPLPHGDMHGTWGIKSFETEKYPCGQHGN